MFQTKLVFKKRSFQIAFLAAMLLSALSFILSCLQYRGLEINAIPSAEKVFVWNDGDNIVALSLIYLFPVLCVLPFADSFIAEKENNMLPVLLPKLGAKRFFFQKLGATALSAFAVVATALLFNLALCCATFPTAVNSFSTLSAEQSWFFSTWRINNLLFPSFYLEHP